MTALEFERKLKKLNQRLYVSRTVNTTYNPELFSSGIYFQNGSELTNLYPKKSLTVSEFEQYREVNETPDLYVSWCTWRHIPEGTWIAKDESIIAPGWRQILLKLSAKKYIDLQRARKVFSCPSLGLSTYDLRL
jgi:hypothetical protein